MTQAQPLSTGSSGAFACDCSAFRSFLTHINFTMLAVVQPQLSWKWANYVDVSKAESDLVMSL